LVRRSDGFNPSVGPQKGADMMFDPSAYQGIGQFGRAYRAMFENDAHASASVDRVLVERMVRLCTETAAYLYRNYTPTRVDYERSSRPELETHLAKALRGSHSAEERVAGVARFCSDLASAATDDLDAMRVGGAEEEIIRRGSDWCTDVARVGCCLSQVAGLPARLVMLADTRQAYSGHVIIEVRRRGRWGAVDVTTNVIYLDPDGKPASTWELMKSPELILSHRRGDSTCYTTVGQFRAAAISNYFVRDRGNYDYTTSPLNAYCRSILEMSKRSWPGGLRWLHREDAIF